MFSTAPPNCPTVAVTLTLNTSIDFHIMAGNRLLNESLGNNGVNRKYMSEYKHKNPIENQTKFVLYLCLVSYPMSEQTF